MSFSNVRPIAGREDRNYSVNPASHTIKAYLQNPARPAKIEKNLSSSVKPQVQIKLAEQTRV